jgi:hypothetical protein
LNWLRKNRRFNFLQFGFLICLLQFVLLLVILPARFLFADDWVVLKFFEGKQSVNKYFELYNGHQMALTKFIWWIYGFFWNGNPTGIAILNCLCLLLGLYLITNAQFGKLTFINSPLALILALIIVNNKQIINVTTIITTSWCLGTLFLGIYFHLKNRKERSRFFQVIVWLSPFTNGIGLLVPIVELATGGSRWLVYSIRKVKFDKIKKFDIFTAGSALLFSYIFPLTLILPQNSTLEEIGDSTQNGQSLGLFGLIIHYARWALVLLGSVFAPSTRFNPLLAEIMGLSFAIFFISVLFYFGSIRTFIREISSPGNSTFAGSVYMCGIMVSRGDPTYPLLWATSPRYMTGTIVFVIGACAALIKSFVKTSANSSRLRKFLRTALIPIMLVTIIMGMREGYLYQKLRHDQAKIISICVQDAIQSGSQIEDLKCYDSIFKISAYEISKVDFVGQLRAYLQLQK